MATKADITSTAGVVVPLDSKRGQEILVLAKAGPFSDHMSRMMASFVHQKNTTFCAIVSLIVCNNSFDEDARTRYSGPLPSDCKEDHFMSIDEARQTADVEKVNKEGLTLDEEFELARALGLNPIIFRPVSPSLPEHQSHLGMSLEKFRSLLKDCLGSKFKRIIANYFLPAIGQPFGFGHFSPLGGYHEETDMVLLLDVWPETPVGWVKLEHIYNAMNTVDSSSGQLRGICLVDVRSA
eukprot:m.309670 g.309670  ORF g.309670 m.309670 type:complete len:238 (+) comp47268_c0_seq1:34-747(+)